MAKFLFIVIFCLLTFSVPAQEAQDLHENAKTFMRQNDYANASLILVRVLKMDPSNLSVAKDLAFSYYFQNDFDKGLKVLAPFLDNNTADDQSYQIAGLIYKRTANLKEADKIYKKALKNFPKSGPLYNDYGELLWATQDNNAIKIWEKGIQEDPGFGTNYYNASKYYFSNKNKIWSLLYGEIFVNIESYTARSAEMKNLLLEGYKKLFLETDLLRDVKDKNAFELAYLTTMNRQNSVVQRGISPESLVMIRTRFILDWNKDYATKFPFQLFELHNTLLTQGLFQAYNQWMFGSVQNLSAYQNWVASYKEEYAAFSDFQKRNIFRMPEGQYDH